MLRESSRRASMRAGVFSLVAAALLVCLPLAAQTFRGTILGSVSDPTGAAISGATVTAKNIATGIVRTTQTTGDAATPSPNCPWAPMT